MRMMSHQVEWDQNYKKDDTGILEVENYNNWNEKFIRGAQH